VGVNELGTSELGRAVGTSDGDWDGKADGRDVGVNELGTSELGRAVGIHVGDWDGKADGEALEPAEGDIEGDRDGKLVG